MYSVFSGEWVSRIQKTNGQHTDLSDNPLWIVFLKTRTPVAREAGSLCSVLGTIWVLTHTRDKCVLGIHVLLDTVKPKKNLCLRESFAPHVAVGVPGPMGWSGSPSRDSSACVQLKDKYITPVPVACSSLWVLSRAHWARQCFPARLQPEEGFQNTAGHQA